MDDARPAAWHRYEQAVMAGDEADAPGDGYVMSPAFEAWLVDKMRAEVLGQVQATGLDRMAILRDAQDEPQAKGTEGGTKK